MEEDPFFAPLDETSPTTEPGKQESRGDECEEVEEESRWCSRQNRHQPRRRQKQVENSINITQDEDDSPKRYASTHFGKTPKS